MQPSEKYIFEDVTADGFSYKRTVQNAGSIFPLYSELDASIAYTLPQMSSYRTMTPTLINKSFPQRSYTRGNYYQEHYATTPGGTLNRWATIGNVHGTGDDDASCAMYWTFTDQDDEYYFNGNEGNSIIGDSSIKFISGFDISHVIFSATITGYTKAQYDAYKSDGSNQTASTINLEDLISNPNDYYIKKFAIHPVCYWDSTNQTWKSGSPVFLTCLVDGGSLVQGISMPGCLLFCDQQTSASDLGTNCDTYHIWSNTQNYTISDSTQYVRKGGIPVGLLSNNPYSLGSKGEWFFEPTMTSDELDTYIRAQVSTSSDNTTNPKQVLTTEHGEIWAYDKYNVSKKSASYSDVPGAFYYSKYDKVLTYVGYGSKLSEFLASAGCYFHIGANNANYHNALNNNNVTPDTLYLQSDIGLGVMSDDGTTNGTWVIGDDIENYEGINKKGDVVHPSFNPSPTPSGGGDELLDMNSRGQFYGSGLTRYYVDPPAAKLQKALGDWDNIETGKDVLKNLLSYKILCFPSTTFSTGVTDPFVIAGVELHDEDDNVITAKRLTSTGAVSLPSIPIPKTFNDFRDYAPYTTLQMFVPLCGWVTLPPWCVGRTINGEMYINPYSGTVRCLVRADGNVVAEMGGNAAIDLPFSAEAVGVKSAAVISSILNTAGAVGTAIAMPNVSTIANVGSAALGTVCALNANYTESKGSMGDGSNVYGLYNVFIKITRPATIDGNGNDIKTIPQQYKHDHGIPCAKAMTIAAGDGYTQVIDANITGNMTAAEKQMIIDGFRHGLIISANAT